MSLTSLYLEMTTHFYFLLERYELNKTNIYTKTWKDLNVKQRYMVRLRTFNYAYAFYCHNIVNVYIIIASNIIDPSYFYDVSTLYTLFCATEKHFLCIHLYLSFGQLLPSFGRYFYILYQRAFM